MLVYGKRDSREPYVFMNFLENLDIGNISTALDTLLPGRVQKIIIVICAESGNLDVLILQAGLNKCLAARLLQIYVMSSFHTVSCLGSAE